MPSSVLHDHIPHLLLFFDQPLYFLPPHVLGYTCFVHILTPGQDKFSTKATKCIFLGTLDFRRVIVVIPLRLIDTFSLLMSPSLRTHPSPLLSLFLFLKSYPFPLSPRLYLILCLLDHFRFIIVVTVPLFKNLACVVVQQTIQFSIIITLRGSVFIWLFLWTTSSLQAVIRMIFRN